jgi:hypothetical protein
MSVYDNETVERAHKNALAIVRSSASLVAAVKRATTHAPYWIDATDYPPRKIRDPHEPRIKQGYLDLIKVLKGVSRQQLRTDSKDFTQVRPNGPYRALGAVFPNAHFASWQLGEQIEAFVSQALHLSSKAREHLFLPCLPRPIPKEPPIGRYSLKAPNWLERRIRKHFKKLSEIAQQFPDPAEWEAELEWEYSHLAGKLNASDSGSSAPSNRNGRANHEPRATSTIPELADARAASKGPRVELRGRHEGPIVLGKLKKKLTKAQYNVVQALLQARDLGLTKDQLVEKSGHTDAVNVLKNLAKKDSDWKEVIHLAGITGGGYRLC